MSDPSAGATACRAGVRRNLPVIVLLILLAGATTGWVVTATTREWPVAAPTPEPLIVPVLVPVVPASEPLVTMPADHEMTYLVFRPDSAMFVTPGRTVDVLATVRRGNKLTAFPLLENVLVLAVDRNVEREVEPGTYAKLVVVSLAVTQKQALALTLAKQRRCCAELLLRSPDKGANPAYDLGEVIKLLQDEKQWPEPPEGKGRPEVAFWKR